jgi:type IV pilus assembly protein PilY1
MRSLRHLALAPAALALLMGGLLASRPTTADDLDIYLGLSAGSAAAPNVMILIDNSSNWSRSSQMWTSSSGTSIVQGQAELQAIQQAITFLNKEGQPIKLGLAMLTSYNTGVSTGGGYIRVGVRDVTNSTNATDFQNILTQIYNNVTDPSEKVGIAHKDETAALYEVWKYFSGLTPFLGAPNATNTYVDYNGNLGGGPGPGSASGLTPYGQGLTTGFGAAQNNGNWQYQTPINSTNPCASNYVIYIANNTYGQVGSTENVYEPTVVPALNALPATSGLKNGDTWTDEWTRFFYQSGAQVPSGNNNGRITTFVLDAYNAQNDPGYSASLKAAAIQGGGRYYQVGGSTNSVYNALVDILTQIQAVNSTFASASLPVNATSRAQNDNQVFIPMFRPDGNDQPRWMGNLKEYQLINDSGNIDLGDSAGNPAVNTLTGFPTACALSFWTTDSTDTTHYPNGYWDYGTWQNSNTSNWNIVPESTYAKGTCATTPLGPYTDDPDGPIVEKGGVAEVIRKGNNPPTTNTTPTWSPANRDVLTLNGLTSTTLVPFNTSNTGLPSDLVNWILGQDVQDENGNGNTTESRPSIHGDSVHSRPLPVDYGSGAVTVFYGSNDGTFRAVDASTGRERWAFIPPEFYTPAPTPYSPANYSTGTAETPPTGLERLMWSGMADSKDNQISPLIKYFGMNTTGMSPTPRPKDYYMDGSVGIYEGAVNASGVPSSVWIYPVMRRGGRMIYAMDVTNPASPQVLWKFGCPSLVNDSGCVGGGSNDVTKIGQTWSTPSVAASVLGYSSPVVIVGGGYDTCETGDACYTAGYRSCEDENTTTPDCTANGRVEKGAGVYILDARTGQELKFFSTARSVAADISLIAISTIGVVDHAYVADTGGDVYRIDFNSAGSSSWTMSEVAYTNGGGRKFLYGPALLAAPNNQVYVALGSGDREHPLATEYPYVSDVDNRFYVFKDSLASTSALNLDDTTKMNDFSGTTTCSTQGVLPTSSTSGWFLSYDEVDEPDHEGEQTVTSAVIAAGMVSFSTNRPVPSSQGSCSTALGVASGYWVNLFNASGGISASGSSCGGTRYIPFVGEGLPPSPVLASVPVDGSVTQVIIGAAQLNGGASTAISPQAIGPAIVPKRKLIYWKSSGTD